MNGTDGIAAIIEQAREDLAGQLRGRVRAVLEQQPRAWLVEQLLDLALGTATVPAARTEPADPGATAVDDSRARAARIARVRAWGLDADGLRAFVERYRTLTREALERDGLLIDPPPKDSALIAPACRSRAGELLLLEAKDLLYALLFGDRDAGVRLDRVERELLTLTMPRAKAHAVAFVLQAATEIGAHGRRDPLRAADDDRAPNTVLQVEYGETADELVGHGITVALKLINNLEVNEQVLYARMENVEESTLE
ncbi:hypothetical protein [Streptomyces aurantiogriseus]|uniref:Uncharacterized protein n=1 Tax=Streptomyces aurantiogriseus TaxID=66870 RepID=A0A918F5V1_9ACTN|nr:hypothetical protein [Streptomyces aurantiogriseus]GGR10918.1 hypothetical protein GCM10010251_28660 [Streptomyces aurantiogriseus]